MDSTQEQQILKINDQLQNEIKQQLKEITTTSSITKLVNLINQFEPNPKLLDANLDSYIEQLTNLYLTVGCEQVKIKIGEIIYTFAKIRGFKQITLYFSSDLYLISKLINLIKTLNNEYEIFLVLIWLCNLVLVPFDLHDIDENLSVQLYEVSITILKNYNNGSKNQIICSILLSRLVTRSDCENLLNKYFQYMDTNWSFETEDNKLGYYLTINQILKRKQLSDEHINMIYQVIIHDLLINTTSTTLHIIYSIKILSKLGIYYIKTNQYNTVTSIINNLINDIMNKMIVKFDTSLRFAMAKGLSSLVKELQNSAINYQTQLIDYIISQLGISTPDYIVDLHLNYAELNIAKYHTILLTMGYISLSRSLPLQYTTKLLNICHQCLFFKVNRLSIVLGKQIRDSSCFIIWSISRTTYNDNFNLILVDLFKVLMFDTDLIIKKCCIAVIQEIMGRYNNQLIQLDQESRGEFVIRFMNIFNDLIIGECITYQIIDLLIDKLDLSFLVLELVKVICESDGDGTYLRKLLDQPKQYQLVPRVSYSISDIIDLLVKYNRYHILFDLQELPVEKLSIFHQFKYTDSKQDLSWGYLRYLIYTKQVTELDWENLFKILKLDKYVYEYQLIFSQVSTIPFNSIMYHLPNSIILSHCLFNYKHYSETQIDQLINIMKDSNVNADIRSNIINNLSNNFNSQLIPKLYDLFDDYTITIQGDVGSKIRIATINLVRSNINYYKGDAIAISKLIRLSGELMDKIRLLSFEVLHELIDRNIPNLDNNYWYELFKFYKNINYKLEFWRGLVFTLGSFTGNQQILNNAFEELLRYSPNIEDLQYLLQLLNPDNSKSPRSNKCVIVTLNVFLKLFQANWKFPTQFKFRDLFIKCYNLHINTNNITRITIVIRIFYYLSQVPDLQNMIYTRLIWLLKNSKLLKIKLIIGQEILFEIINDLQNPNLLSQYQIINWENLTESDIQTVQKFLNL